MNSRVTAAVDGNDIWTGSFLSLFVHLMFWFTHINYSWYFAGFNTCGLQLHWSILIMISTAITQPPLKMAAIYFTKSFRCHLYFACFYFWWWLQEVILAPGPWNLYILERLFYSEFIYMVTLPPALPMNSENLCG